MFNLATIFGIQATNTVSSSQKAVNPNFHEQAIVDEAIYPHSIGRVYFQATWWPARCECEHETIIKPGELVYVVGIENITLLVRPATFL
ncbi:MAG TPA: NfeD family protein [Kamptonema sp.]|nr:NfeD family protein [Kamptonema sp.]